MKLIFLFRIFFLVCRISWMITKLAQRLLIWSLFFSFSIRLFNRLKKSVDIEKSKWSISPTEIYTLLSSRKLFFWQKETRKTCVCFSFVAAFFAKTIKFFFSSITSSFVRYLCRISESDLRFFTHSVSFSLFNFFEYYLMPFPFGSCSLCFQNPNLKKLREGNEPK